MKKPIFLLSVLFAFSVAVQSTHAQTTPNAPFAQPNGLPASPVNSGLPAGPVNAGLPGFTNVLGPFLTNQLGSNFFVGDLAPLLVNLQIQIEQTLPSVIAMNGGFDFTGVASGMAGATNGVETTGSASPGNASTLLSRNLSAGLGRNLSRNIATPTSTPTPLAGTTTGAGQLAIAPPTSSGTIGGLAISQGTVGGLAFNGIQGNNNLAGVTDAGQALRALVVLQSDMERMLQLLAYLNGGAQMGANTNLTSSVNNRFVLPGTTPAAATSRSLTPTGR